MSTLVTILRQLGHSKTFRLTLCFLDSFSPIPAHQKTPTVYAKVKAKAKGSAPANTQPAIGASEDNHGRLDFEGGG